ncbi:hypothetical protein [Chryseobacterium sp. FH1]|uniref:hypothetical protein n=1 Tax=Chryseobacterium sp. FH1 TaxID=1233951 RepID=UPI0004E31889|nr:hypothetical protein [Chryseobacterium sp. FH1]KFC20029.1 hypothetical protein IO90_12525 [Chryseobacterium sp. FH1]
MLKIATSFFSILLLLPSCKEENIRDYEKYEVRKNLKNNEVFKNLNQQNEFDFGYRFRKIGGNQKRSNNLEIKTELGQLKKIIMSLTQNLFFKFVLIIK